MSILKKQHIIINRYYFIPNVYHMSVTFSNDGINCPWFIYTCVSAILKVPYCITARCMLMDHHGVGGKALSITEILMFLLTTIDCTAYIFSEE